MDEGKTKLFHCAKKSMLPHLGDLLCVISMLQLQIVVVLDESPELLLESGVLEVDLLQLLFKRRLVRLTG